MKDLRKNIISVLGNENGGPNVDQLIGIAVALSVGSGLFLFGTTIFDWFDGPASATVEEIGLPDEQDWFI